MQQLQQNVKITDALCVVKDCIAVSPVLAFVPSWTACIGFNKWTSC